MPPRARENRGPGSIATTSSRRFLPPHDRLGIGIFEEAFEPALDANARLLHAAEGRRRGEMLGFVDPDGSARDALSDRSEEHTSELQSLMRISYAVFCLKKK